MSNPPFRSARQQCADYINENQVERRRDAADKAVQRTLEQLALQHGSIVILGALMRYVGLMLVVGAEKPVIHSCCRYLARKIVHSVFRRFLTRPPMLH